MFMCKDCGMNTAPMAGNEYYAVTDEVWKAGKGRRHVLCIGCLETRIGRKLKGADFPMLSINFIFPWSARLASRMGAEKKRHRRNIDEMTRYATLKTG